jgi:uncharacterized lipoprotein NlpE involved in copper resistance
MNMKRILIIVMAAVLAFSLIGCDNSSDNEKIGIRGEVTNLSKGQDNKTIFILVEGELESDTMYDKASITITSKTKVIEKDIRKKLSIDDLKEGMLVEVILEGPVRESYPIQADAKEVRVID